MVSRGSRRSTGPRRRQHGLTFPIVLQKQWEISREYGKFATPIGYLVDAEGIIAKEVAIGVEPILSLLSARCSRPTAKPMSRAASESWSPAAVIATKERRGDRPWNAAAPPL